MSETANKQYDHQEHTSNKILPQELLTPDPDEAYDNILNYTQLTRLNEKQRLLIKTMVHDYASNNIRSESQLALDIGVSRKFIYNCKSNSEWSQAFGMMMVAVTGGEAAISLQNLREMETDRETPPSIRYQISKFKLQYGGSYVPKKQVETRNLSINVRNPANLGDYNDVVDRFLIKLGTLGWNIDQIITRWQELKREQAW